MAILKVLINHQVLRHESFVDPRGWQTIVLRPEEVRAIAIAYAESGDAAWVRIEYEGGKVLMEVINPCREMPTRHCPIIYNGQCGEKPCARFESRDEAPWIAEHTMSPEEKVKRTRR